MKPWFAFKIGSQKGTRNVHLHYKTGLKNRTKKCSSGQINTTLQCPLLWSSGLESSPLHLMCFRSRLVRKKVCTCHLGPDFPATPWPLPPPPAVEARRQEPVRSRRQSPTIPRSRRQSPTMTRNRRQSPTMARRHSPSLTRSRRQSMDMVVDAQEWRGVELLLRDTYKRSQIKHQNPVCRICTAQYSTVQSTGYVGGLLACAVQRRPTSYLCTQ